MFESFRVSYLLYAYHPRSSVMVLLRPDDRETILKMWMMHIKNTKLQMTISAAERWGQQSIETHEYIFFNKVFSCYSAAEEYIFVQLKICNNYNKVNKWN